DARSDGPRLADPHVAHARRRRRATSVALDRGLRRRRRREPPLPRLAGLVRPASVPAVERALVLRGLGGDRRSILLGGAARRTGVGLPAPLGAGAPRTPGHEGGHHGGRLT